MIQQDPKILITDSFGIKKKINKKVKKKDLNSIMNAQVLFSPYPRYVLLLSSLTECLTLPQNSSSVWPVRKTDMIDI